MTLIRVNNLEGHYTIKRLRKLPKRGNSNWLYTLAEDNMSIFYLWTLDNEYEKISIADSLSFATAVIQGTNIVITGTGTSADPYIVNAVPETAAETPVTPVGNLTSTNVQDALEELQSDVDINSVQSDFAETDNTQRSFIQNKPTNTSDFNNDGANGTSPYVQEDNTRLPRIVSGLVDNNTGIVTFIRDDSSNFTVDFSGVVSGILSVVAGANITVDNTDPQNPIISGPNPGIQSIVAGANVTVDNTDPLNPVVSSSGGGSVTVDDALSLTSTNPAENSIVTTFTSLNNEELLKLSYNTRGTWRHDTVPRAAASNVSYDRDVIIVNIAGTDYQLTRRNSANVNNDILPFVLEDTGKKFYVSIYSDRFNLPYYFLNREFNFNYNLVSGAVALTGLDPDYTANEIEFISAVPGGLTTNLTDPDRVLFSFILSDVAGGGGGVIVDDTLSDTSTNPLENQEIESNFQLVSSNLSQQMRYRAPGRSLNYYVHGNTITTNDIATVPFTAPVVWFAADGSRFMAVEDTQFATVFFQAFFEKPDGLVQAMFTRASTIPTSNINYEERIAYNTLSTTPFTTLVNAPANYTIFEVQASYTLNFMFAVGDVTFADSPFMSFSWVKQPLSTEGTWTPELTTSSGNNTLYGSNSAVGTYYIVDKLMYFNISISQPFQNSVPAANNNTFVITLPSGFTYDTAFGSTSLSVGRIDVKNFPPQEVFAFTAPVLSNIQFRAHSAPGSAGSSFQFSPSPGVFGESINVSGHVKII